MGADLNLFDDRGFNSTDSFSFEDFFFDSNADTGSYRYRYQVVCVMVAFAECSSILL
jgi:hypothetical protein